MATIVTYAPLTAPTRDTVDGKGRVLPHRCSDVAGQEHQQRLPLGSVQGVLYLDALCLYCGKHFVWVEEDERLGGAS